jgi:uncharacterized membrane protein
MRGFFCRAFFAELEKIREGLRTFAVEAHEVLPPLFRNSHQRNSLRVTFLTQRETAKVSLTPFSEKCSGDVKIIASIENAAVIRRLNYLYSSLQCEAGDNMNNSKRMFIILWGLVVVFSVAQLANELISLPILMGVVYLTGFAFALLHGAMRYRWRGILALLVIGLIVPSVLEGTSILTGFPFGHYHYSSALGPKLFKVPLLIGPGYFFTGYLAWVLSTTLVGDVHRYQGAFKTIVVPFIATFIFVTWDVVLDPTFSTIRQQWIWEQGGGYFGVPLTNYLGWFFTAFVSLLLFALFLHVRKTEHRETWTLPRSYYAQVVVIWAVTGLSYVLAYVPVSLSGSNTPVTDASGTVWQSRDIYQTAAMISIYTMLFVAALAAVKLLQGSTDAPSTSVEAETHRTSN